MPMIKHEMTNVFFFENLPLYDISSHNHKFLKTEAPRANTLYGDTPVVKYRNMTHHYRQVCFNLKTKEENIKHKSPQL